MLNGQELAALSSMELMAYEEQHPLTDREMELLEVIHRLKGRVENYEAKCERQIETIRQLRYEVSETKSGLKIPRWART